VWAALTVFELLHVVVEHRLLQGALVVGADALAVAVQGELPVTRPEKERGAGVLSSDVLLSSAMRPPPPPPLSTASSPRRASDPGEDANPSFPAYRWKVEP